ncbi:host specificity factor TipJ family phage tail protein [Enterovirga sp. CN4-39]|uniref:host specificity factor TipJ family phage tail protein n=1 Tax=Enterovirga sp. CN4-39 TaxID=3400910 RepID=UPI003C0DA886
MRLAVAHKLEVYDPELAEPCPDERLVLPVRTAEAVMGESVTSFLERSGWRFDLPTVLVINGEFYGRAEWDSYKLALNDNVAFLSRPGIGGSSSGGSSSGGKSIMALVGLIALSALAPWAGAAVFGAGTVGASIFSAVLIAGGSMLLSFLLKPKPAGKTQQNADDLYSFAFSANAARPLQAIPVGYGRRIQAPDLAAPSYTEYSGDSMVEYALFSIGGGRYDHEEIRIGDTTIWTKAGGTNPDFPGLSFQMLNPGEQVTLFPVNVVTASEVSGIELTQDWSAPFTANAAETTARKILVDFVWPSGCFQTDKKSGKLKPTSVFIVVEARFVNAAGAPTSGWFPIFTNPYTFAKQSQIRVTEHITVQPGRYEVRVRRENPSLNDSDEVNGQDSVQWTALRAHIDGPQSFPVSTIAIRAEANKSLSGVTNGKVNVISTRILPVWDMASGQFVEQPTRSPAWAALDAWRNDDYSAGLPISHVDFQSFVNYAAFWETQGHCFDHFFTEPVSLDEALETILKAGRARPAFVGDRLTIVRDEPRGIPRMLFNDFNIVRDSLTIDYVLANDQFADGVVGQYLDETSWKLATVSSAPDGVMLAKPAQIEVTGVTRRAQAAGLVRFHAAESQYRRVTVSWQTGAEGKLLKFGDLVVLSSEQPEDWGRSVEVTAFDQGTRRLTLNPAPSWDAGALNHYIEVQRANGQSWGPVRVLRGPSDAIATVNASDHDAEAARQGMTLWQALARKDTAEQPLANFSPAQPRSFRVLITEGTPDQDGEHMTLKGVVDAPEVYDVTESGVPPLPSIPDIYSQSIPTITTLGAQVYQRGVDLILSAGWQPARGAVSYVGEVSYDGESWVRAYADDRTTFEAVVGGAPTIRVRVAGVTVGGVQGPSSVVEVVPPNLVVSPEFVFMRLRPEDFEQQIARRFEVLDQLQITADLATESLVIGDEATDLGKAAIRQIQAVEVDVDRAYAIFGTEVLAKFQQSGATVSQTFTALAEADQAQAQATQEVSSELEQFSATVTENLATLADADEAQAQATQEVVASVGDLSASVTQQANALALINGQLTASYIVKVAAGGYWSGFQLITQDGSPGPVNSEFRVAVDKFLIGAPGVGIAPDYFFSIATVGGQARVAVRGDLIADGTVSAGAMQAQSLSAISANLGTVTAGIISISGGNGRIEFWD